MIRGTTAQFRFKMPYNFSSLSTVKITFWQENYNGPDETQPLPIVKVLSQCRPGSGSKELVVSLNEEETLRFTDKRKAYVQMIAKTVDQIAFGNSPQVITVYPVHKDSILDDITPTPSPDDDGNIVVFDGGSIG